MKDYSYQPLKHRPRDMSVFHCKELLYDYVQNRLDDERCQSLEQKISSSKAVERELDALNQAFSYLDKMSSIEFDQALVKSYLKPETHLARVLDFIHWGRWPELARWGFEAFVVAIILVCLVIFVPWSNLRSFFPKPGKRLTLMETAKIPRPKISQSESPFQPLPLNQPEKQEAGVVLETDEPPSDISLSKSASDTPPVNALQPKDEEAGEEKQASAIEKKQKEEERSEDTNTEKAGPPGLLFRAFMSFGNHVTEVPKLVEQLQAIGAKKAGQVELGWRKPKGSYFHFSIPEANRAKMEAVLRNFGPVRIYKEKHWRVMPEGEIRFILWVEDTDLKK